MRGPFYNDPDVRAQFSGHETFPLRYGWLKKVYDAVAAAEEAAEDTKKVFSSADAIARFGVGKNMVVAMRYWSLAAGIIDEAVQFKGPYRTTPMARRLLADDGWDPWLEEPASLWLLHWELASTPNRTTTWYWTFNHFAGRTFDGEQLAGHLAAACAERGFKAVAPATLKGDVSCFVRSYVHSARSNREDSLECPLTELGLIRTAGRKDRFELVRGPKASLPPQLFAYFVCDYWRRNPSARTLALETVCHEPGSPGRVSQMDEESVVACLSNIESLTDGALTWSETAGLRQLISRVPLEQVDLHHLLDTVYINHEGRRAA